MKCLQNTTQRREEPLHWSAFCGFAALGALRPQRPRTFAKLHRSVCGTQPASSKTDAPLIRREHLKLGARLEPKFVGKTKKMPPGTENG
jgi:hypothetical protein